jgi:hypothetical protein
VLFATVREHSLRRLLIRFRDKDVDVQMPFSFGAFLGQNVARERVSSFDLSTRGQAKSLLRSFVRLQFWH